MTNLPSLSIVEGKPIALDEIVSGRPLNSVLAEIGKKNQALKDALRTRLGPISIQADARPTMCVSGIAGSLKLFGRQVEVLPKFSSVETWHDNIMVLLTRAYGARFELQEVRSSSQSHRSFVDHLAQALARALEVGLLDGPIETYRSTTYCDYVVRGRLDVRESLQVAVSQPGRVVSTASELHADNPYNHLLHCAADMLLTQVGSPFIRSNLQQVKDQLPPLISIPAVPRRIPDRPPLQFAGYSDALQIAAAVVQDRDWGLGIASSSAFGYVVAMEQLFERFVENTLRRVVDLLPASLHASSLPQVSSQFAYPTTEGRRAYFTRPDNVMYLGSTPRLIIDAKYKRFADAETGTVRRPANSDVYQMFATMAAQKCQAALLLYPTHQGLDGSMPIWRTPIGSSAAFVAAVGLPISNLKSTKDLMAVDQRVLEACLALLELTGEKVRSEAA